jgi:hypothetical protein
MKGYVTALGLSLLLGAAGAASAITSVLDFNDPTKSTGDLTLVTSNADGKPTDSSRGSFKVKMTGGTDANRYIYVDVKDGLFDKSAALWMRVDYYDEGTDQFQIDYNGDDVDASTGDRTENAVKTGNPGSKQKFDTKSWTNQIFKLPNFRFFNGLPDPGKNADLRIDDLGDGPEIVSRITLTDQDPEKRHFAKNNPANPVVVDGKIGAGEWDGAYSFTMDAGDFDAANGANWTGKEDYSGTYYFKWDEKFLYVRGDVTDDVPLDNTHADETANHWQGDGLELYIGLDQTNPNRTHYLPDTDFQFITGMGGGKSGPLQWAAAVHHGDNGVATTDAQKDDAGKPINPDLKLIALPTDRGYMFEYQIPWTALSPKATVKDGQVIGWNMFGNDGDGDPSGQDTAMSPFKRKNMWVDPSGWTTTVLEPNVTVDNPTP